jgi:type IV secretory pathway TraG/TraD family ATPase VirD4
MQEGAGGDVRTWFVLDELASLQKLPQLATATTESRKANCVFVLGLQGKAQAETLYGHVTEAMLSQLATKLFFKTSEPNAAEWISKSIGDVELERYRESSSEGKDHHSESEQREIVREPLVMASEITGLEPLEGYLKHGNYVVHLRTAYVELPTRQPAFVPHKPKPPESGPNGSGALAPSHSSSSSGQQLAPEPSTEHQQDNFYD